MSGKRRLERASRTFQGPPCPTVPEHGEMLWMETSQKWYCSHIEHAGRTKNHPLGATPSTQSFFASSEVQW